MAGKIETRQDSDGLVFYEGAGVSRTTSGHSLLKISPTEIKIGSTGSDVDFKVLLGSEEIYALFDAGSSAMTIAGVDVTITGDLTIDTEDIALGDGDSLEFGDSTDISFTFTDGTALAMVANTSAENFTIGDDTNAIAITLKSALTIGKSGTGHDVTLYGNTAGADVVWDMDGDTNGSLALGASTTGIDVKMYGTTAGNYVHWDRSADDLLLVGTATTLQVAGTLTATTTTTGSLRTAGGLGVVENAYIGGVLNVAGASTLTGAVSIDDTTESSSTVTGSLHTDGGLGVAKKVFIGGQTQLGIFGDGTGVSTTASGNVLAIYSEVPSGTTVADTVRSIRSRMLVNQAQTADCSIYGVEGNCRVKANLADGVHAGVWAYYEQSGTVTLSYTAGAYNAGLSAAVETASTFTLNANVVLAGVLISSNAHDSGTYTGNFDAIYIIKASGCETWQTGLTITDSASLVGIDIGSCTTGLDFTGTYTGNALDFSNATIDPTGSNGPCMIRCGSYGTPYDYSTDQDQSGIIRLYTTTSAGGTSYDRVIFACAKTTGTKNVMPIAGLAEVLAQSGAGPTNVHAGEFICNMISATAAIGVSNTGAAGMAAIWAKVGSTTGSATNASSRIAPIWLDSEMNGTVNGESYHAWITAGTNTDAIFGIHSSTGAAVATNLFYFDDSCDDQQPVMANGCDVAGAGADEPYLKVLVKATAYGIPLIAI